MRKLKIVTPYLPIHQAFSRLRRKEEAVFLDSSSVSALGRYSIIACRPYQKLVQENGCFTVNGRPCETPFLEYAKRYLEEEKEANDTGLPIVSGAVGYFSYDFGQEKEGVISRHEKEVDIPESILTFYDVFLIEDHETKTLYLSANGKIKEAEQTVEEILTLIATDEEETAVREESVPLVYANFSSEEYKEAVDDMIRYIIDGDIYVVNMTQQLQIESSILPYDMFCRLREKNPSPFGGYLDYGTFQIVCASPERFMQMRDGKIRTRPIKGTRKRGNTPEEDQQLKEELAGSEKDQSELLMIVDLERNDLNRVCIPGTVKVTELFEVETYATVFHLIANVEGQIRPDRNAVDLIEAAFPGGSITGAPKLRAMELIDLKEHSRRNLYTGSIGYLSLNGDCDFNIVIRTAVHKDGVYHLGVGGGITCESDLAFEYEETWQKAKALLDVLGALKGKDGEYVYSVR